jgi:hypothetical protein
MKPRERIHKYWRSIEKLMHIKGYLRGKNRRLDGWKELRQILKKRGSK